MNNIATAPRGTARHARRAAVWLSATAVLGSLLTSVAPASAADSLPDGLTSATAAGSCWEIKENDPSAQNGVYWLLTPALKAPEQFYCDQTTDGGGWVMIARGRNGWKENYNGLRSPALLRNTPDGTGAFAPAQLPAQTVDALVNNSRIDALADGVRIRRAQNATGTQWQEVRFKLADRDRWAWTFAGGQYVASFNIGGATGTNGRSNSFGTNNAYNRVDTVATSAKGWVAGMGYGSQVTGTNAATTYLFSNTNGAGSALPFAQMFVRPKLTIAGMDFATIPDSGAPAQTLTEMPESDALRTVWGVSGLSTGTDSELNTEVQAFGQVGSRVYVGGNFRSVQRSENATGADRVDQPFLAAFDVNTGELVTGFRPRLNGQVKAIVALPDGRVAVGGEFTQVNGAEKAGFVILDAATGATNGWQVDVENRSTGVPNRVRGLTVSGNWLYASGSFTHWARPGATAVAAWNGARINLSTGAPDGNWNPTLNGTAVGVDAPASGDRAYFSGYFNQSKSVYTPSATALSTSAGANALTPVWQPRFSKAFLGADGRYTGNFWQWDVEEAGGRVWLGGSEHSLFNYNRSNFELLNGNITNNGGDFQTIDSKGNLIYAGCHCGDWVYYDSYTWNNPSTNVSVNRAGAGWKQVDKMNIIGAWNASTGDYLQEFSPVVQMRRGFGAWAVFEDSTGTLWAGGDFRSSVRAGEVNQWSGGFVRFAKRDGTAPTTPGSLAGIPATASTETLQWGASTDARSSVSYEVIRENKVVATTTARTLEVPVESSPVRYFVRAVDAAGNRSATTAVYRVTPPSAEDLNLIQAGSDWKWTFTSAAWDADWRSVGYDDSSWATGSAVLGLGSTGLGTNIGTGAPSPRPLSAQFRRSFTIADSSTVTSPVISVVANDGVVVYVNGTEIGRRNMPTGNLTQNSYATAAPRTSSAVLTTFEVPRSLLRNGVNVVSASTHANYRSTPDLSFDLSFVAKRGAAQPAPAAPSVTASATGATTAELTWTQAGAADVVEYRVSRDGSQVAVVDAPATSYSDSGLSPETAYTYSVVAVGASGKISAAGTASVTTKAQPVEPEDPTVELVEAGSDWRWRYESTAWPAGWNAADFDDSAWKTGAAVLGFNTAGLGTDILVDAPTTRPLSAQFRAAFEVADPAQLDTVSLTVLANDGVVVYVNGTEVGRRNLPTGNLTQNSYATAAPRSTSAAVPVTFEVPVSLLTAGTNVVAASTHLNYRSTPDVTFDLSMTGTR
ncbi:fibrinogen-like YCDxxxxGGGW domain-containing protein [Lysobacter korlensis]|uniref:Fibrinogen-like YCDxxxxGGGW domain-containing protein n=1 Tax=Lysobacter korlensis TaxID=553636 RepID=A0ABV6RZN5_9GAMM